jgi:hypothetical protein
MIPTAKAKITSVIEATEESIQGIGEGFKHGATLVTGLGVGAAENVTTLTKESTQKIARETPRAIQDMQKSTESTVKRVDQSIEDTKRKGLATKVHEKLEGAKHEASGLAEGGKPIVHEM